MEEEINDLILAIFTTPQGAKVMRWMADTVFNAGPITVIGQNGADPVYAAFRDGQRQAYTDLLERAGFNLVVERKNNDDGNGRSDRDYRDNDRGTAE